MGVRDGGTPGAEGGWVRGCRGCCAGGLAQRVLRGVESTPPAALSR